MKRREFPAKVCVAAFERAKGHCEGCGAKLQVGRFHYDHIIADGLGGEPTLSNCAVLCHSCHGIKTATKDQPLIAKVKRNRAAHIGAKAPSANPMPGSRNTKFKKRMDGSVVLRGQTE